MAVNQEACQNQNLALWASLINSGQIVLPTTNQIPEAVNSFTEELSEGEEINLNESEPVEFDKETFIDAVKELRSIWDVTHSLYKDRNARTNSWKKLSSMFGKEVEFLQRQWKNLKDAMKKCLDKRNRMTRSGAGATELPKCKYFNQLAFLRDKTANKITESNVSLPQTSQTSEDFMPLSPLNSPTSSTASVVNKNISKKRRTDSLEQILEKSLVDCDSALKEVNEDNKDEDSLYCRSLVPILKDLPVKKRRLAKIKISQLLYDLEFEVED